MEEESERTPQLGKVSRRKTEKEIKKEKEIRKAKDKERERGRKRKKKKERERKRKKGKERERKGNSNAEPAYIHLAHLSYFALHSYGYRIKPFLPYSWVLPDPQIQKEKAPYTLIAENG